MASIKEIRTQRMGAIKDLRKLQRTLDTKVEVLERYLFTALKWKEKVPDQDDLEKVINMVTDIERATSDLVKGSTDMVVAFQF